MDKRQSNAKAHQDGRRAYAQFVREVQFRARNEINHISGVLAKKCQWNACKWTSGYTEHWINGFDKAKMDAERDGKASSSQTRDTAPPAK